MLRQKRLFDMAFFVEFDVGGCFVGVHVFFLTTYWLPFAGLVCLMRLSAFSWAACILMALGVFLMVFAISGIGYLRILTR